MATRVLLFPFCKPLGLTTTLTACTILAVPLILQPHRSLLTYRLDTLSQPLNASSPQYNSLSTDRRRKPINPRIVRQITVGSVIGLIGGLFVSQFSKPLAVILGLFIFGVQYLETRGIHIIRYDRIQRFFKDMDVTSLLEENASFKLSFGATFALAAFASF